MNDIREYAPTGKEVYERQLDADPELRDGDEIVEADTSFEIDRYQVVRREFFAHSNEPTIRFDRCVLRINAACIKRFPRVDYVQILINPDRKILALKPCSPSARDAFLWKRIDNKGKTVPKNVTCRLFYAKLVDLMRWDPNHRYKLLGRIVHANGEYLIVFDLTSTEVFERSSDEAGRQSVSRTPMYPAEWKDQFGVKYREHEEAVQIDIFDGYAVFTIQDTQKPKRKEAVTDEREHAETDAGLQKEQDPSIQNGAGITGNAETSDVLN